jgi:parallel beta-helix repeat protein
MATAVTISGNSAQHAGYVELGQLSGAFQVLSDTDGLTLTGNTAQDSMSDGIYIAGPNKDLTITSNNITNVVTNAVGDRYGIVLDHNTSANGTVTGNSIDFANTGIYARIYSGNISALVLSPNTCGANVSTCIDVQ